MDRPQAAAGFSQVENPVGIDPHDAGAGGIHGGQITRSNYDNLDRLTGAGDSSYSIQYQNYGAIGNMASMIKDGRTTSYTYGSLNDKPHAVKAMSVPYPMVGSFLINNGDAQTFNSTVTLNNVSFGSPTHFMASEDKLFNGAAWLTYSSSPSFVMSGGPGIKTVYFKVKNADGESNVKSDSIILGSCSFTIVPDNQVFGSSGGNGAVGVTATPGCSWSATSNAGWITITSGNSGSGNGAMAFSVSANSTTSQRIGTMTIADKTVTITESGQSAPDISVNPTAVTFNPEYIGDLVSHTVTLSNNGSANLVISSLGISGGNARMFSVSASTCPSLTPTLSKSSSCTVNVGFKPKSEGVKSATLVIGSNDPDKNPLNVPLSGTGVICPEAEFVDVPQGYWAEVFIKTLACNGITAGCKLDDPATPANEALYCPEDPVTRAQMAVFLERGENGSSYLPPSAAGIFADVPLTPTPYWAVAWIEQLYNDNITSGCWANPPLYCPDNPVTRAQMAVFLLRVRHGSTYVPPTATGTMFNDVTTGTFAASWIEELAVEGITAGCGGGNYCPDSSVTRAQMAVFLTRVFLQ